MSKSAYVCTESGLRFLTLRNISDSGVCLDSWPGVTEGDDIEFCIDSGGIKKGKVSWVKDGLCGIGVAECDASLFDPQCLPPRAVIGWIGRQRSSGRAQRIRAKRRSDLHSGERNPGRRKIHRCEKVILETLADTVQVKAAGDPRHFQLAARSNARQQQDMRRADRARA